MTASSPSNDEIVYVMLSHVVLHDIRSACVLIREGDQLQKEIRTFWTMTSDILLLHDWLLAWEQ